MPTLGLEMEMVAADGATGQTRKVSSYFRSLLAAKTGRGEAAHLKTLDGVEIAVLAPEIISTVDNAFNNLESCLGPVADYPGNLAHLDRLARRELADVAAALAEEGAVVLNFSQHPAVTITPAFYRWMRAPKPIYDYWTGYRRWNHMVGVDAKAQNGPTTGVEFPGAVMALNVLLAFSPAFIALYANSPFEGGRLTGLKETRLTIWPRMFGTARFAGDDRIHRPPPRPFRDLADYFTWMFGPGTVMQALPAAETLDYKTTRRMIRIGGDPSALEFLRGAAWRGHVLDNGAVTAEEVVVPTLHHLEFLQFSHFLDARIRYALAGPMTVDEFHDAWTRPDGLEDLFSARARYCYMEGRSPGAVFPDRQLAGLDDGDVARSAVISPSALQKGLLANARRAWTAVQTLLPWAALPALRDQAMRHGLDGTADGLDLRKLARLLVDLAADGLEAGEEWMLAYPRHVLETGQNAADRALALWERLDGSEAQRMAALIRARHLVPPEPDRNSGVALAAAGA